MKRGSKGSQWRRQTAEIARRADSQQTRSDTALYKSQLFIIIIKAEEALKKGGHEALVGWWWRDGLTCCTVIQWKQLAWLRLPVHTRWGTSCHIYTLPFIGTITTTTNKFFQVSCIWSRYIITKLKSRGKVHPPLDNEQFPKEKLCAAPKA